MKESELRIAARVGVQSRRKRIDATDRQIVGLLNRRTRLAIEIGLLKTAQGLPLRDPEREHQIMQSSRQWNSGPLSDSSLRNFFRWLLQQARKETARRMGHAFKARRGKKGR